LGDSIFSDNLYNGFLPYHAKNKICLLGEGE
jgi:hypothetical protein